MPKSRAFAVVVSTALLAAPTVASAAAASQGSFSVSYEGRAFNLLGPRMAPPETLPRAGVRISEDTAPWIIGARPGTASRRLAREMKVTLVDARLGLFSAGEGRAGQFITVLKARRLFRFAEPDIRARSRAYPQDPLFPQQWALPLLVGDRTPPRADPKHHIAIIESNFDGEHPDAAHATFGNGANGAAPRVFGDPDLNARAIAHGTAVVSVASGSANGVGVTGVWPGQTTKVYSSSLRCSNVATTVRRAADAGAAAINMSYGFLGGGCWAHHLATNYAFAKGSALIAAAGNSRHEVIPGQGKQPWSQPANDDHVLTVGSINSKKLASGFSHQNLYLDVVAPGERILVANPLAQDTLDGVQDGYTLMDGTSFAAPAVAAVAAWISRSRPRASAGQIHDLIRQSATDLGRSGYDRVYGFGLVNLDGALKRKMPWRDPLEPNEDVAWIDGRHIPGSKVKPLLRNRRQRVFWARLDKFKDRLDIYPVWVPANSYVDVHVRGNTADLFLGVWNASKTPWLYNPQKGTVNRRGIVAISDKRGRSAERVIGLNTKKTARVGYVVVATKRSSAPTTAYRLSLRRAPIPNSAR